MGRLKLSEGYYITNNPCLPINWISPSILVAFEGAGSPAHSNFDNLQEQSAGVHFVGGNAGGLATADPPIEIVRHRVREKVLLTAPRTSPFIVETRSISATEADIGPVTNTIYDNSLISQIGSGPTLSVCGGGPFPPLPPFRIRPVIEIELKIATQFPPDEWVNTLTVVTFDTAGRYIFTEPVFIEDARFLSFNITAINTDFTNEQISKDRDFCNKTLRDAIQSAGGAGDNFNKLTAEASSVPQELNVPFDLTFVQSANTLHHTGGSTGTSCSMSTNFRTPQIREYWLLEPQTSALDAAFNEATPNDAVFDDPTSLANMVEAAPGLDADIFGVIRTFKGNVDSFSWSSTNQMGTVATPSMFHTLSQSVDTKSTFNTIQFSKNRPMYAVNGGIDMVEIPLT